MRRIQAGFSLVELMVVVVLSLLVTMGAFHVQNQFNRQMQRQQMVNELQQTMRVSRQIIERRFRAVGSGFGGRRVVMGGGVAAGDEISALTPHNRGRPLETRVADDSDDADDDNDADWFEFLPVDPDSVTTTCDATCPGISVPVDAAGNRVAVFAPDLFRTGDLFYVQAEKGRNCVLKVTGRTTDPASPNYHYLRVEPDGAINPPAGGLTACLCPGLTSECTSESRLITAKLVAESSAYEVVTAGPRGRPSLRQAKRRLDESFAESQFEPVAEGIDDMQIEVITETGQRVFRRDPTRDHLARARAIRFTLTGRSSQKVDGFRQTLPQRGDLAPALAERTDGFVRRSMQTSIMLRTPRN